MCACVRACVCACVCAPTGNKAGLLVDNILCSCCCHSTYAIAHTPTDTVPRQYMYKHTHTLSTPCDSVGILHDVFISRRMLWSCLTMRYLDKASSLLSHPSQSLGRFQVSRHTDRQTDIQTLSHDTIVSHTYMYVHAYLLHTYTYTHTQLTHTHIHPPTYSVASFPSLCHFRLHKLSQGLVSKVTCAGQRVER